MSKNNKGYDYFLVKGGIMQPTIESNQVFKMNKTKDVKVGDIVVFKQKKGARVIHRVVKVNGGKVITKGDNKISCDRPFLSKDILGKVIKIGNKRIDTAYYRFINPVIAWISYLNPIYAVSSICLRKAYKKLSDIKTRLIGDRKLYVYPTLCFLARIPNKVNYYVFRILKK